MDRIKRKRRKMGSEKKVLLSIVDPWDVKVASVDPVGLAARRGVSLSTLPSPSNQDEGANSGWSTLGRPVTKTPSPWYKPGSGSSSYVSSAKSEESALIDSIWLNSRYSPRRSSSINATHDSPSPIPSRERSRDSKQKTDDDVEASEVDNGLINGSQEISRDSFDDVNGTAVVRVRFEIDKAAESCRNGVRCDAKNGQSAPRVLTTNWNANDNYSKPEQRVIAKSQNRETSEVITEKQKDSRETSDAKISERNANDDSRIIEKNPAIVDIVQQLVESRYSPQIAKERKIKRMSSCHRQEASKEIDPVGKTTILTVLRSDQIDNMR